MPINGLIIKPNMKCPWCNKRLNTTGRPDKRTMGHILKEHRPLFVRAMFSGLNERRHNGQPKD